MFKNYFGKGILFQLTDIWIMFSTFLKNAYDILTTPLSSLLNLGIPFIDDVLDFVVNILGIGNWTLMSMMIGSGLLSFIVLIVVKFMKSIVSFD